MKNINSNFRCDTVTFIQFLNTAVRYRCDNGCDKWCDKWCDINKKTEINEL